ncbi:hypothetical protein BJ912DRAFT_953372 [Pholiota molesta]|nr:hypothetical protein BJ912DRAFT_953372 [Pholiota molesta]
MSVANESLASRRHAIAPDASVTLSYLGDDDDEPNDEHHQTSEPPQYEEYAPPQQAYDPTASLDSFAALHISDRPQNAEPIPRAPSAMSLRSLPPNPAAYRNQPRHAMTLPPPHAQLHPQYTGPYSPASIHSEASSQSQYSYNGMNPIGQNQPIYDEYNQRPYDHHPQNQGFHSPDIFRSATPQYPPQHAPYPQQHQWSPPPNQNGGYNTLHFAASDVLGMAPPPPPQGPDRSVYAASIASGHSGSSAQGSYPSPVDPYQSQDFDSRPPYQRAGTSASLAPSSTKSKAIDLNSPPFTKEYIDQYRQRIKADPDPEAHFLYAKYLIDAAKNIRTTHKDQRAAKKYSEVLVTESLKVIRRLATQGEAYAEAQFFLANCYGTGALGLQVDHERAYHLYLQAAKQNHAAASYRVAVCNEIGAGTKKEPARAAAFYRKAASLGDTPGMFKLGMVLLHGTLEQQPNQREAINWLKRAAEQADEENPHALHELALLYENPSDTPLGYTPSQYKLGQCYEYGSLTCPVEPRRSIAWYTKAAEKGDSEAELALSGWYLTGSEGVLKQSDSEAYLWARRAANKGLSKAEYAVGYYAEVGIGIKQDVEFAKRWYMRAAAQGNKRAMNRLTEMKRMGAKRGNIARPTRQQAKDECVIG